MDKLKRLLKEANDELDAKKKREQKFLRQKNAQINKITISVNDVLGKGLYYLYFEGKIMYVGMSDFNVMERISKHYRDIKFPFDEIKIELHNDWSKSRIKSKETQLIKSMRPIGNTAENPDTKTYTARKKHHLNSLENNR